MDYKTILYIVVLFMLSGCAVQDETVSERDPKLLITQENHETLDLKPHKEEPVQIDYRQEGITRQSIDIHKKVDPVVANQLKFIDVAAFDPTDELIMHYENGANFNFRNDAGETALIKVLDGPYDNETYIKLKYLISIGAKLNTRGKSGKSPAA